MSDPKPRIYFQYVPKSWNEKNIAEFFSKVGPIVEDSITIPPSHGPKYAFVDMVNIEDAQEIIEKYDDKVIEGSRIRLEFSKKTHQDFPDLIRKSSSRKDDEDRSSRRYRHHDYSDDERYSRRSRSYDSEYDRRRSSHRDDYDYDYRDRHSHRSRYDDRYDDPYDRYDDYRRPRDRYDDYDRPRYRRDDDYDRPRSRSRRDDYDYDRRDRDRDRSREKDKEVADIEPQKKDVEKKDD